MAELQTESGPSGRIWAVTFLALIFSAAILLRAMPSAGQVPAVPMPGQVPGVPMPQPMQGQMPGPMPGMPMPGQISPSAPAAEQDAVVEVRIEGNRNISEAKIRPLIRTRAGRPFDQNIIEDDVRRLHRSRMFISVTPEYASVPGGRRVIFRVVERQTLQEIKYCGNSDVGKKALAKETGLKVGDPVDSFAVEEGRRKIEEFYRKKGYSKVHVSIYEGDKPTDTKVTYVINEGRKQKIKYTLVIGNTIDSSARLIAGAKIKSTPPFFWLFGGELDRKQLDEDKERLTAYYRSLGFFRARVGGPMLDSNPNQDWVNVTFVVDEGPRSKVRSLSFAGNTKFSEQELTADLKLKPGEFFNQGKINADKANIEEKYGSIGYVFADVKAAPQLHDDAAEVDLVYKLKEGDRYRIALISPVIKGETPHTRLTTVMNMLTFAPGDIADIRKIRESERRLRGSKLFMDDPMNGNSPKIVFTPPELEDKDKETEVAGRPKRRGNYRSQSPDPLPGERYAGEAAGELGWPCSGSREREATVEIHGTFAPDADEVNIPPAYQPQPYPPAPVQPAAYPAARSLEGGSLMFARNSGQSPTPMIVRGQYTTELSGVPAASQPWQPQPIAQPAPAATNPGAASNPSYPSYPGNPSYPPPTATRAAESLPPPPAQLLPSYAPPSGTAPPGYGPAPGYAAPPSAMPPGGVPPANVPPGYAVPSYNGPQVPPAGQYAPQPPPGGQYAPQVPPGGQYAPQLPPNGQYAPQTLPPGTALPPCPTPPPGVAPLPTPPGPNAGLFNPGSPFLTGPNDAELTRPLNMRINTEETQTGRLMLGVGVNSDAGLVGQIMLDEQNFDWQRFPRSWEDIRNATAFRGAGQQLRIQAVPGTQVQQYSIDFRDPYFMNTDYSLGLEGHYFQRLYREWNEGREGGRISIGYHFTHHLSGSLSARAENVNISIGTNNTTDPNLPPIAQVLGNNGLYGFGAQLMHDTRDSPFLPTQGHVVQFSFEQVIGSFQYPHGELDVRKYFVLHERPDGSGRHVLSLKADMALTDGNTPVYDKYYAGGFSTIRGFEFRGLSPVTPSPLVGPVATGGDLMVLGSAEYMFPITADDMLRAVVFCDTGTVQPTLRNWTDKYQVSPGLGLRITIPAMGPAPIALDFAFPVSAESFYRTQVFSFYLGMMR